MSQFSHSAAQPLEPARRKSAPMTPSPLPVSSSSPTRAIEGSTARHTLESGFERDMLNEPADLAFVTRQILNASAISSSSYPLAKGLINPSALALAGHSDGGTVVGMLALARGVDPRAWPIRPFARASRSG